MFSCTPEVTKQGSKSESEFRRAMIPETLAKFNVMWADIYSVLSIADNVGSIVFVVYIINWIDSVLTGSIRS